MVCVRGVQVPPMHAYMAYDAYAQGRTRKKKQNKQNSRTLQKWSKGQKRENSIKEGKKRGKKEKELRTRGKTSAYYALSLKQKKTHTERIKYCPQRGIMPVENSATIHG